MKKVNVLVVEDESIVALDIKSRLQNLGYAVVGMVSSGEEAVRTTAQIRPDIVLMDIKLKGGMDGIDAAEQIRIRFDIPIIYLTAYADEITLQRAKITESFGYLLKPFEERELTATIETALYKHTMERRLKENEQWLSTTLKSIGDAVIATNSKGQIKFMNPVAETLTGWTQEEALDQPSTTIFKVVLEETQTLLENPVTQVLRKNVEIKLTGKILLLAQNGRLIPIDSSAAPIRDEQDHTNGVVLVFRDITEQRQTEAQILEYTAQLQAHNDELDAFAHTVAHDLQSPLGHLVSLADALRIYQDTMSASELQDYLDKIVQSGLKMSSIIDSLLLLAGVRRKETVEMSPLDMEKILAEIHQRLAPLKEEYQAEIIVPDSWPTALGYAPWVEEVWANYLSNGIKYGGKPPVLKLGADRPSDKVIRFWVRDNGPGLTSEEQDRLFLPFTKLSQVQTKGQGLGLSIVRRIVEKLGGQVGVESTGMPGQGCLFYFMLPAANNNAAAG